MTPMDQMPNTRPRIWGGKVRVRIAMLVGWITPAPSPCTIREVIRESRLQADALKAAPAVNSISAAR